MTTVTRKPWFLELARPYVRRRLRRDLDGLHVEGLEQARALVAREPIIIASTHVAWWDALIAIQMDHLLGAESYCLMDAKNLGSLPFFGWVGAVPLRRDSPKNALKDMKAGAKLLDRPGRAMWIFPQGRQRPSHLRPLDIQQGVRWLARASRCRVLPMSLTYAFREAPVPSVLASFGTPIAAGANDLVPQLEQQLIAGLDRIDRFVEHGEGAFETPLDASGERVPLGGRLLGWLGRRPQPLALPEGGPVPGGRP